MSKSKFITDGRRTEIQRIVDDPPVEIQPSVVEPTVEPTAESARDAAAARLRELINNPDRPSLYESPDELTFHLAGKGARMRATQVIYARQFTEVQHSILGGCFPTLCELIRENWPGQLERGDGVG